MTLNSKVLFKNTIVIWTDYNPAGVDIEDIARDASIGDAFLKNCNYKIVKIKDVPNEVKDFMLQEIDE